MAPPHSSTTRRSAAFTVGLALGFSSYSARYARALVVPPVPPARMVGKRWVRPRQPAASGCSACSCERRSHVLMSGGSTGTSGRQCSQERDSRVVDRDVLHVVVGDGGNNVRHSGLPPERSGVEGPLDSWKRAGISMLAGLVLVAGTVGGGAAMAVADVAGAAASVEPTSAVTVEALQKYDGFEDYAAQGQQMENSDVGCFANECKRETASCFTDGSCLKVCCLIHCGRV